MSLCCFFSTMAVLFAFEMMLLCVLYIAVTAGATAGVSCKYGKKVM